jgi:hypothetical protein
MTSAYLEESTSLSNGAGFLAQTYGYDSDFSRWHDSLRPTLANGFGERHQPGGTSTRMAVSRI